MSLILYPISFFETWERKGNVGLAYTELTHLGFVIPSLQFGVKIEEYIIEMILLELKLVFVLES